jgi:hypothetical protein
VGRGSLTHARSAIGLLDTGNSRLIQAKIAVSEAISVQYHGRADGKTLVIRAALLIIFGNSAPAEWGVTACHCTA